MGLAYKVQAEGNEVRLWIRSKDASEVGDGLVPKVGDLEDLTKDAEPDTDVFVFDVTGNGIVADKLRADGFGVVGGSQVADMLERDRAYGLQVMESAGIESPPTHRFTSFEDGIAFAKESKERLVYKPSKHLGDESPSLVANDSEELVETLLRIQKDSGISDPEFELQEFIEGAEVSTECWFDGSNFIEPMWNHTFERKQLMNENLGPSGGCTGNIVWACGDCPVCDSVRGLGDFLRSSSFVGPIDVNAILADSKVYGLEFTPRFGYDASPTLFFQVLEGELGHLLHDVAQRQYRSGSSPGLGSKFGAAVRITIPPWPTEKYHASSGVPIRGLEEGASLDDVYLYNVKLGDTEDSKDQTKLASAGAWGILLLPTGRGDTVGRAFAKPYRVAEQARIPDKQYRTDLVEQFKKDFDKIEAELGLTVNR
jgi:phosphoribosylamine---glycine ligase